MRRIVDNDRYSGRKIKKHDGGFLYRETDRYKCDSARIYSRRNPRFTMRDLVFRTVCHRDSLPNRLENWFGPQYVDPLLAWHFCRFLDFTNNYNDRWKRKRAWDGRWRDEKIFEISIQFEFSMFGVGFGIDGYWLDICSLWNNGILNAYYRGILFWGGKRFNFFTFDFCIDGIRLMYSFLFLFFSIEGKFKKKIYSNEMLLRDFIGGKSENFIGINFRYSGYNIRNGIKLIPFLSISLFLYSF